MMMIAITRGMKKKAGSCVRGGWNGGDLISMDHEDPAVPNTAMVLSTPCALEWVPKPGAIRTKSDTCNESIRLTVSTILLAHRSMVLLVAVTTLAAVGVIDVEEPRAAWGRAMGQGIITRHRVAGDNVAACSRTSRGRDRGLRTGNNHVVVAKRSVAASFLDVHITGMGHLFMIKIKKYFLLRFSQGRRLARCKHHHCVLSPIRSGFYDSWTELRTHPTDRCLLFGAIDQSHNSQPTYCLCE